MNEVAASPDMPVPWWRKDAVIFAALIAIAAVGFAATYAVSSSYARREDSLARHWYRLGETALGHGDPKAAISDFRTALLYSRDNPQFRLRLAQALAADNDIPQAMAYFLNLWDEQPGSGLLNLELARLYARDRQPRKAAQYYNNAIFGFWPDDAIVRRREARVEYVKFLLAENQQAQAQAEALALAQATPSTDVEGHLQAADLLLTIGDPEHALLEYESVMKAMPAQASYGAARAAFQLGHFRSAAQRLRTALAKGVKDPAAQTMQAQAEQVLGMDPFARHLSAAERANRVNEAYGQAGDRLHQCAAIKQMALAVIPPTTTMQQLYAEWLKTDADARKLAHDSDLRDSVMDLVFRIENATAQECGEPTSGPDWALLMLSRYGDGVQQ